MKNLKSLLLLPFISLLQFCHTGKTFDFKSQDIDEIQYAYHDASVPPQFQRNYTIVLTPERVSILTNFRDSIFTCTPAQFNNIIDLLQSSKLSIDTTANDDGCPGGDYESLSCSSKGKEVFSGSINYCGSKRSGTLKGDIEPAASAILKLIPDMEKMFRKE